MSIRLVHKLNCLVQTEVKPPVSVVAVVCVSRVFGCALPSVRHVLGEAALRQFSAFLLAERPEHAISQLCYPWAMADLAVPSAIRQCQSSICASLTQSSTVSVGVLLAALLMAEHSVDQLPSIAALVAARLAEIDSNSATFDCAQFVLYRLRLLVGWCSLAVFCPGNN